MTLAIARRAYQTRWSRERNVHRLDPPGGHLWGEVVLQHLHIRIQSFAQPFCDDSWMGLGLTRSGRTGGCKERFRKWGWTFRWHLARLVSLA